MPDSLCLHPVRDIPDIEPGDDLTGLLASGLRSQGYGVDSGGVLVVAQKIVSKAEGRYVCLRDVRPGARARELALAVDKDPRLVELILAESKAVIRQRPGVLIVEHRSGHILANAGIDASNIVQDDDSPRVLLWPEDPDHSARTLATGLSEHFGHEVAVIINDSIGRAWRIGTLGHAIGVAGIPAAVNQIGEVDRYGNTLRVTEPALADPLAAAAALVQGEAAEGVPAVWVTGVTFAPSPAATARDLLREPEQDLFR